LSEAYLSVFLKKLLADSLSLLLGAFLSSVLHNTRYLVHKIDATY